MALNMLLNTTAAKLLALVDFVQKLGKLGKLGKPAALIFDGPGNPGVSRVINLDGDWYTGFKSGKKDIYIIEFKKKRLRDFAVLL